MVQRSDSLLDHVRSSGIVLVGVNDYITVRTLVLKYFPTLHLEGEFRRFRLAFASLLATDRSSWQRIWELSEDLAGVEQLAGAVDPLREDLHADGIFVQVRRRYARYVVLIGAVLLLLTAPLARWVRPPHETIRPLRPITEDVAPRETKPANSIEWIVRPVNDPVQGLVALPVQPVALTLADRTSAIGGSLVATLGLILMLAPARLSALRRRDAEALRAKGAEQRRTQSQAAESTNVSRRLSVVVPAIRALSDEALSDSATILARIYSSSEVGGLDIGRTISATVASGFFRLVPRQRAIVRHVTILIDREKGDHPWLADVDAMVSAWRRLGVDVRRYDFSFDPTMLRAEDASLANLGSLARRVDGDALLIVSRQLAVRDVFGRKARWLNEVSSWARGALLDPAPVAIAALPETVRRDLSELNRHSLPRFPMSDNGIRVLANYFAGAPPRFGATDFGTTVAGTEPNSALEVWLLFAAVAPGVTWRQLQHARVRLPGVSNAFPTNRHLQLLLDEVERANGGRSPESGNGRTLALDPERAEELINATRRRERHAPLDCRLEVQCRKLFLEQLSAAPPSDPLMEGFWNLKRAEQQLGMDPETALDGIRRLTGGAWHDEVLDIVETVLRRDALTRTLTWRVRNALRLLADENGDFIRLSDLLRWPSPLVAFVFATAAFGAYLSTLPGLLWTREPARAIHVSLPRDFRLTMQESPADQSKPEPGGVGSQDGHTADPSELNDEQIAPTEKRMPTSKIDVVNRYVLSELQPLYCEAGQQCSLTTDKLEAIKTILIGRFDTDHDGKIDRPIEVNNISCETLQEIKHLSLSYTSNGTALPTSGILNLTMIGFAPIQAQDATLRISRCKF